MARRKTGKGVLVDNQNIGQEFDSFDGILLCEKYINPTKIRSEIKNKNRVKSSRDKVD